MIFTLRELLDLVIMTVAIGYIFSAYVRRDPLEGYDPIVHYSKNRFVEDIKQGTLIAAPAIVLHELAHKFVAMAFGATATLHAPLGWYALVVAMRLLNFPLLFFVGGYVTIQTPLPPLESAIVSFAGPLTNLLLYLIITAAIRFGLIHRKYYQIASMSGRLNLFLFIFNMIPLPGFDGYNFFSKLVQFLFR